MTLDKRRAAVVVLAPAALLVAVSLLPWATGTASDVLSRGTTEVTGGSGAPGAVGLAVVAAVALLALLTGGRVIRTVSAVVGVLAALGALLLVVLVAARPTATIADAVARELGRTTSPGATGTSTPWAWVAVVVAVLLVVGTVAAGSSAGSWHSLSARYERGAAPASGPRGEVRTAWDELSEGGDPTLRDAPDEGAAPDLTE